jgi:hypothetical protein
MPAYQFAPVPQDIRGLISGGMLRFSRVVHADRTRCVLSSSSRYIVTSFLHGSHHGSRPSTRRAAISCINRQGRRVPRFGTGEWTWID